MEAGELRGQVEAAVREALDTLEAFANDVTDRATEAVEQAVTKVRDACNDFLANSAAEDGSDVSTDTAPPANDAPGVEAPSGGTEGEAPAI